MVRLLLIFEDIAELNFSQTYLKKVGFDCVSMSSELGMSEKMLTFRPEVIILSGKGHKLNSREIATKLRIQHKYGGHILLIGGQESKFSEADQIKFGVDKNLQPPVTPIHMIESLAEITGQVAGPWVDKYQRSVANASPGHGDSKSEVAKGSEKVTVAGAVGSVKMPTPDESKKRSEKYKKAVEGLKIDTHATTLRRADVKKAWKDVKSDLDKKDESNLNDLKRQFATALFKKNK